MRAKAGDCIELFNGRGALARTRITSVTRRSADFELTNFQQLSKPNRPSLILASACPKGDRLTSLIEKATELGVDQFVPLETERTVVRPQSSKWDRLFQTMIGACKQSGRHFIMKIAPPTTWNELLTEQFPEGKFIVAHPGNGSISIPALLEKKEACKAGFPTVVCIGPEGGFSEDEIAFGKKTVANFTLCSLGMNILRVETAAVLLSGILLTHSTF